MYFCFAAAVLNLTRCLTKRRGRGRLITKVNKKKISWRMDAVGARVAKAKGGKAAQSLNKVAPS